MSARFIRVDDILKTYVASVCQSLLGDTGHVALQSISKEVSVASASPEGAGGRKGIPLRPSLCACEAHMSVISGKK